MLRFKMSKHMTEERADRLMKICVTIGGGEEIVLESRDYSGGRYDCILKLSDTGVLYVVSEESGLLITAYVASPAQVKRVEEWSGKKLPSKMWARIVKNQKIAPKINESEGKVFAY